MPSDPTPLDRLRAAKFNLIVGDEWVDCVPLSVAEINLLGVTRAKDRADQAALRTHAAYIKALSGQQDLMDVIERQSAEVARLSGLVVGLTDGAIDPSDVGYLTLDDALGLLESNQALSAEVSRLTETLSQLRGVAREMHQSFNMPSHPGQACRKSNPVPLATLDRWAAALESPEQEGTKP